MARAITGSEVLKLESVDALAFKLVKTETAEFQDGQGKRVANILVVDVLGEEDEESRTRRYWSTVEFDSALRDGKMTVGKFYLIQNEGKQRSKSGFNYWHFSKWELDDSEVKELESGKITAEKLARQLSK
jgi:hypothetical protein